MLKDFLCYGIPSATIDELDSGLDFAHSVFSMPSMQSAKTVWLISDGKKGHENQSLGLLQALEQHASITPVRLLIKDIPARWRDLLWPSKRFRQALKPYPHPDLIIGTGSRTHRYLLACKRATQAPTIVLMAPARGLSNCFDRCIVPQHDQRSGSRIIPTLGALNTVVPAAQRRPDSGLILIGGPSKHHDWDSTALNQQIEHILMADPQTQWTLTNSRRTPDASIQSIDTAFGSQLKIQRVDDCAPGWLAQQLSRVEKCWVSEDSVSMIYEALSGGAQVGILPVPRKRSEARILRGLEDLIASQHVHIFKNGQAQLNAHKRHPPLAEAQRVAALIAQDFFGE
jgi:mitochondrial fission protein ELM1